MSEPPNDREYFFSRRTDKTIASRRIEDRLTGQRLRIFSKIVEGAEGLGFGRVGDELVLRTTTAGRYEIKATVVEEDRSIRTLTIQKFNSGSGPSEKFHFSFVGSEIRAFIEFVASIATADLPHSGSVHLPDDFVRELILSRSDAAGLFAKHQELFVSIAESADVARDLVAVGYRRKQLERFELLLRDESYLEAERVELGGGVESVWQKFFEENEWIFGYGLSYQYTTSLDRERLEQIVAGHNIERFGKRADALLKTRGALNSVAFAEIKRHDSALLDARSYRPGVWSPSRELVGAVSQVQATVQDALETYARLIQPINVDGLPSGENLLNVTPRSFVVIGRLSEFVEGNAINQFKWRAFELYRRNTHHTEVLTFDELYERAKFIVEQADDRGNH